MVYIEFPIHTIGIHAIAIHTIGIHKVPKVLLILKSLDEEKRHESGFLEASLVRQADGKLKKLKCVLSLN
jgi:hypothetical protein